MIAGDVADEIGGGQGVVPAESIAGVALIADGRRQNGVGQNPGRKVGGVAVPRPRTMLEAARSSATRATEDRRGTR